MEKKKYCIQKISDIKIIDNETGEEVRDIRDREPIKKEFDQNKDIITLVKKSTPSYDLVNNPLISKYGYGTFGMICEAWYWKGLEDATELELWKIYGLIKGDESNYYRYQYDKEVYEHRKLVKDRVIKLKPSSMEFDSESVYKKK